MLAREQIAVVWNPSKTSREELAAGFNQALGADTAKYINWFETAEDEPGGQATKDALDRGSTHVFAAGGDGTVRTVAECLAEQRSKAELGIIPMGTGNLLARNLNIALGDPAKAILQSIDGQPTDIDIGWVTLSNSNEPNEPSERHAFAVMAGFGIDANMITETNDDLKNKVGWLAYVESLGRAFNESDMVEIDLEIDGIKSVDSEAHTMIIGNCGSVMGGMTIFADADPADGQLDSLILSASSVAGWLDTMRNMVWQKGIMRFFGSSSGAEGNESVSHRQFKKLSVSLSDPRSFEVDGDHVGEFTKIDIEIQAAAVRVRH